MASPEPGYRDLYRSGELHRRVRLSLARLRTCRICPRLCRVDRNSSDRGVCETGRFARVASHFPHLGEEDVLRGERGSGTIFFSSCNLRCSFCQNLEISSRPHGREVSPDALAALMLDLQERGCHNLNFVTPSHVVPQILEALEFAAEEGLRIPLVYNCSGFESIETLELLEGVIDIYMPDFKFWSVGRSRRWADASSYPARAREALKEMHRQVGDLRIGAKGLAEKGLLVRHLIMPDAVEDTQRIAQFLAEEISPETYLNLMTQYHPGHPSLSPPLDRRITRREYEQALEHVRAAGLHRLDHATETKARPVWF